MSDIERHEIGDAHATDRRSLLGMLLLAGAPLAFLLALSVRYALLEPACTRGGGRVAMELAALIGVIAAGLIAWRGWRGLARDGDRIERAEFRPISDARADAGRFVLAFACMTGLLFLLASVALWLPSLFLRPCVP